MAIANLPIPDASWTHQGNLLNAGVRRDIADLNRLFLDRALDPALAAGLWFRLPAAATSRLALASPEARERAARSPIALFQLSLPQGDEVLPWRFEAVTDGDNVADGRATGETLRSFGLIALGVARRLAEGQPLASRIAFGFGASCETRLAGLSPSESFRLASWPGLVRPRWPGHDRYWSLLADAATGTGMDMLQWAYSTGLCLLGQCEREPVSLQYGSRRMPRPSHRRVPPGTTDVPC